MFGLEDIILTLLALGTLKVLSNTKVVPKYRGLLPRSFRYFLEKGLFLSGAVSSSKNIVEYGCRSRLRLEAVQIQHERFTQVHNASLTMPGRR